MIQAFRSNLAKKITVVLFALLMLIFLLTSVDLTAIGGGGGPVGKINGERVDARAYELAVQQAVSNAQQRSPTPLTLEEVETIRNQVWEQFIQSRVLDEEFERHKVTASEEEVAQLLQTSPPQQILSVPEFQTEGQFDMAKYRRWLTSSAAAPYVDAFGEQTRGELLRQKLFTVATADVFLSDAALWERYRDQNETARITLTAIIPRNIIPDSAVAVAPSDVEAYYAAHRDEFKRERTAYLSAVALPRAPLPSDTAAARARADSLRAEVVAGAPFAEVARRESSDTVSGAQGGDLGSWTRGQFDPAFDSAAFAMPLKTVSAPVLSSFGFHIIEMTSRRGDSASGRHILVPIEVVGAHRDRLDAQADTLDRFGASQTDPTALDSVARMLKLRVLRSEPVQQGTKAQIGRQVVPDAGVWAFTAQTGEISPVIESPEAFWLFRLDSLADAGTPSLAAVRPAVEAAVRDVKKREAALKVAQDYVRRIDAGTRASLAATQLNLAHREFPPFTRISPPLDIPAIVGAAFGVAPGQHSDILDTKDGIYVIEVLARTPADSAAFAAGIDEYRARAINEERQQRVRNYLASLRTEAKVVDNRDKLRQTAAQQQQQLPT